MKRWKIPALFVLFIGTLLITSFALFLHRGAEKRFIEDHEDLPIHPIAGTSSDSSKKHLNTFSHTNNNNENHNGLDQRFDESTHRQNYRKRFSDAIKGVFNDLLGKNSTQANQDELSAENNSSRLKRQLDAGLTSASAEDPNEGFEIKRTNSPPSSLPPSPPPPPTTTPPPPPTTTTQAPSTELPTKRIFTKRPFMKILKFNNSKKAFPPPYLSLYGRSGEVSDSPSLATSHFSTSSEEKKKKDWTDEGNARAVKKIKNIRRRYNKVPVRSNGHFPSTIRKFDENEESGDDDDDDDGDHENSNIPENPKNFTLEVVQVERKVVRKEDGNIPPLFAKGHFNIEPRLLKTKTDLEGRRSSSSPVVNRKNAVSKERRFEQTPAERRSISVENSQESGSAPIKSAESNVEERRRKSREKTTLELENENNGRENSTSSSTEKRVVIDLNRQVPHDDGGLTDEDLKDYQDGHSTFGSKGNFTHTILGRREISRNVAGFLPNGGQQNGDNDSSHEGLRKRSGNSGSGERKIVIQKGRVTESYPESESGENENTEVYTVPGGRASSESPTKDNLTYRRIDNVEENQPRRKIDLEDRSIGAEDDDLTSPAIQTSLDELYRKGHPGVVPAPPEKQMIYKTHPLSEPYGEGVDYQSPFRYNPLVDEPPLKFDPESDRFYGNPVPDSKEKLGQSNSPVPIKNKNEQAEPEVQERYYPEQRKRKVTGGRGRLPQVIPENADSSDDDEMSETVTEGFDENPDETPLLLKRPRNNNYNSNNNNNNNNNNAPVTNNGFQYGRAYNPPDPEYDIQDYDNIGQGVVGGNNGGISDADFDATLDDAYDNPNDFFDFPGEDGGAVQKVRKEFNSKPDNEVVQIERNDDDYGFQKPQKSNKKKTQTPPPPSDVNEDVNGEDYENGNRFSFAPTDGGTRRNSGTAAADEEEEDAPEIYDSGFIQTLRQFDEEIKKLQQQERRKLLQSHPIPEQIQEETPLAPPPKPKKPQGAAVIDQNRELGYKKQGPPLVISSPGPLQEPPFGSRDVPLGNDEGGVGEEQGLGQGKVADDENDDDGDEEGQGEPPILVDGGGGENISQEVEDAPAEVKERKDDREITEEETVPVSVRSMEEAIANFTPLFKKRSTEGLKENVKIIK